MFLTLLFWGLRPIYTEARSGGRFLDRSNMILIPRSLSGDGNPTNFKGWLIIRRFGGDTEEWTINITIRRPQDAPSQEMFRTRGLITLRTATSHICLFRLDPEGQGILVTDADPMVLDTEMDARFPAAIPEEERIRLSLLGREMVRIALAGIQVWWRMALVVICVAALALFWPGL